MAKKPRLTQKTTPNDVQVRDLFLTPRYATELIIPYLKTEYIWECAAGEDNITNVLERKGFKVVHTDIRSKPPLNVNFLDPLSSWVISGIEDKCTIVTNPPYSAKKQFVYRCIELNVPFALLIPADICGWMIDAVRNYGCQKIVPERRIDYITPNHLARLNEGEGTNYKDLREVDEKIIRKYNSSYLHSLWLTRKLDLGLPEIYVNLSLEDKKRIF